MEKIIENIDAFRANIESFKSVKLIACNSTANFDHTSRPTVAPTLPLTPSPTSPPYFSTPYFYDELNSDLSGWIGKGGARHNGMVVFDPVEGKPALTFSKTNTCADMISVEIKNSPQQNYVLSFDYLGYPADSLITKNLGCAIGIGDTFCFSKVLAAAISHDIDSGSNSPGYIELNDDSKWHSYKAYFTTDLPKFRIIMEDWSFLMKAGTVSINRPGDCFFKNLVLSDGKTIYDLPPKNEKPQIPNISCNKTEDAKPVEPVFSDICLKGPLLRYPIHIDANGDGKEDWICEYINGNIEICYSDGGTELKCELLMIGENGD